MTDIYITKESDKTKAHLAVEHEIPPFRVTVKKGGRRSISQNAYLWGVCYEVVLDHGLRDQGWRNTDLHEYFLGECFGWEELDGFGRKRLRPLHRSSTLNKMEFVDFIAFIHEKAAEMGVVIPDPEEQ